MDFYVVVDSTRELTVRFIRRDDDEKFVDPDCAWDVSIGDDYSERGTTKADALARFVAKYGSKVAGWSWPEVTAALRKLRAI